MCYRSTDYRYITDYRCEIAITYSDSLNNNQLLMTQLAHGAVYHILGLYYWACTTGPVLLGMYYWFCRLPVDIRSKYKLQSEMT